MNKTGHSLVKIILFFLCLFLVFIGQKNIGYTGLLTMLVGLGGLLALLWNYNRNYQ